MTNQPTPNPTPSLFKQLSKLLTLWQEIEAGKKPVWQALPTEPGYRRASDTLRQMLGNAAETTTSMLAELRAFNLVKTELAAVGSGRFHSRNFQAVQAIEDFLRNFQKSQGINPQDLKHAAQFILAQSTTLSNARNFALWRTILQEPHTSGQAAIKCDCSASQASKSLGRLKWDGLAKSVSQGNFEIYSGIDALFLPDAYRLVEAGIIKL